MAKFEMSMYLERWLKKNAYYALSSMPNWVREDDLVQEGKYCWTVVNERYHEVVTEVAHMVALFKSTYQRRVVDIINDKRNPRNQDSLDQLIEEGGEFAELSSDADIDHLILQAPEPVQTILRLLVNDEQRILSAPCRVYLDGTRDTLNNRLHRALRRYDTGINPRADIPALIRRYLKTARVKLYEDPTVVEVVGALVEGKLSDRPQRPQLRLSEDALVKAKQNLSIRSTPKVKRRVRIFPIVEVKQHGSNRNHSQGRVRFWASDSKPQKQVPQRAWTSIRPRVHGDWADCRYERPQQSGNGSGLRIAQVPDARIDSRTLGPCPAALVSGPDLQRPCLRAGRKPQDSEIAVHTNRGKPSSARIRANGSAAERDRTHAYSRATVRDAELLG